jgi:hypothetical protein
VFLLAVLSLIAAGAYGHSTRGEDSGLELLLPELFPDAAAFELLDTRQGVQFIYGAIDDAPQLIGYVTSSQGQGYGGPMTVVMTWSPQGTILDVRVTEHFEDLPWYDTLGERQADRPQGFFSEYIGRGYSQPLALGDDIDAVSGATISCIGVSLGVQVGREMVSQQLGDPIPVPREPVDFGAAEWLLLAGIGVVVTLRSVPLLRRWRWPRFLTLAFSFVVLGVWLAIPLSLTNFAAWLVGYGPNLQTGLIFYILVFGVVGLALLRGKNYYCFWLCPFAAVQELTHFLGGFNLRPRTSWRRLLANSRYFLLWAALFLVLLLNNPTVSVFEPWNALFSLKGDPLQWLLVVLTLVVATAVYNFWCYYLCPVGATMDIILKTRREVTHLWGRQVKPRLKRAA